ncbi:uncharacterized protein BX663DRAFT_482125 [Cokeromyces recurvatus]|uniref:uncharacterized protein n=1 Tax=Cokeromyces recurvatus TaxID=90255 RepID=UPI00221EE6C0|nr:uncharacterized protein BX663DRAFT_482125 [Cokeromyces recurvatus]KAI7907861.1 hypothetical protein BX663DRAFT_482125 [Cokeromyces recurvatus]
MYQVYDRILACTFYLYVINTVYKLDFWTETEWQQWSVHNFDYEATKQNSGIKRMVAHDDLSKDLNTLIKALNKNRRKVQRLKQIKLVMKTIHNDYVNSHFWGVQAVKSAKLSDRQFIAKLSRSVAEAFTYIK